MIAKLMILLALAGSSCKQHQSESQEEAVLVSSSVIGETKTALFFLDRTTNNLVVRYCGDEDIKLCVDKNSSWNGRLAKLNIVGAETFLHEKSEHQYNYYLHNRERIKRILSENVAQLLFLNSKKTSFDKTADWFMNQGSKLKPIEQDVISSLFEITLVKGNHCLKNCL
jgi:hypothetical protein